MHRQMTAVARNALLRPGADGAYADGDDATWRHIDWPGMTRQVDVDGRPVNVVDTGGDGPPVLFVHGLSGAWQNWLLTIPAFMGEHRCIAPDLPGFGASPMPAGEISIRNYAHVVDRVCDGLGVESPIVVGNSMGAFISAELAISFPTRVDRLVLVDAAGISTESYAQAPLRTGARIWAAVTARVVSRQEAVIRRPRLRRAALQGIVRYPERISAPLVWELVQGANTEGFLPAFDALLGYSIRDRLPRIEVPTLIVWGENDILVPVGDAARYQELIGENARTEIFEDTGHMPMIERPMRFNRLLDAFLEEAYRVTAPSEAPETSLAYLDRTPGSAPSPGER
jgi:pimeloyl-ACP methyl ester carboxylesterase